MPAVRIIQFLLVSVLGLAAAFPDAAAQDAPSRDEERPRRSREARTIDPATLEVRPIADVLADADRDTVPDRKGKPMRVRGVVTVPTGILREHGFQVMIQDASGGIGLYNRELKLDLAPGDVVDAAGEVSQYKGAVQLRDVVVTPMGRKPIPASLPVGIAEADSWKHMGRRVKVEGVTGELMMDSFGVLRLSGDDGAVVSLFIPERVVDRFDWKRFARGTRVSATGVVSMYKPAWPYDGGFQVVVSDPADLAVLQPPRPAWVGWLIRSFAALAALTGLSLLVLYLMQRRKSERERELGTLSALSNALAASDLTEQQVARHACDILTAYAIVELAMVQVYDDRGTLRQLASSAADPALRHALEAGSPLPAGNVSQDTHRQLIEAHVTDHGLALLAVHPLMAPSGTVGFLVALSPRKRRPSAMQERTLLAAVKLVAMAIENSRIQHKARIEQQELQQLVITDELTRLYNRRFLDEYMRVQVPLAKRRGGGLAFLAIDIDHFKHVNDTFGHDAGDRVLAGVAAQLRKASRSSDLPVRLGGEEFLVVIAEHEVDGAIAFAERLRQAIEAEAFEIEPGRTVHVTVSIGVAMFGLHGASEVSLLRASDEAMYVSKRGGRNRTTLSTAIEMLE